LSLHLKQTLAPKVLWNRKSSSILPHSKHLGFSSGFKLGAIISIQLV